MDFKMFGNDRDKLYAIITLNIFLVRPGKPHIEASQTEAFSAKIQFSRTSEMTCFAHQILLITEIAVLDIFGNLVTKVQMGGKFSCCIGYFGIFEIDDSLKEALFTNF